MKDITAHSLVVLSSGCEQAGGGCCSRLPQSSPCRVSELRFRTSSRSFVFTIFVHVASSTAHQLLLPASLGIVELSDLELGELLAWLLHGLLHDGTSEVLNRISDLLTRAIINLGSLRLSSVVDDLAKHVVKASLAQFAVCVHEALSLLR